VGNFLVSKQALCDEQITVGGHRQEFGKTKAFAVLKSATRRDALTAAVETRVNPVRFGIFEFDLNTGELRRKGAKVRLDGQPIQILGLLLERAGELLTQDEIRSKLWPDGTVVEFDHSIKTAIRKLRQALGDDADAPRFIETLPRRGYRFLVPVNAAPPGSPAAAESLAQPARVDEMTPNRWPLVAAALTAAFLSGLALGGYGYFHRAPALTVKDTIVLADFTNTTGDAVFDGALRQGLAVQLEQSPFLTLISEAQIQQTLRMMGQQVNARLTPEIAREVGQRTESLAVLEGSVASLGSHYVVGLRAVNCRTGDSLDEEQATADAKEQVLKVLGEIATKLRSRLGESLRTVGKFDTPIEQATTPSLEALQSYSLGIKALKGRSDFATALPLFQRALSFDPNFAAAYGGLVLCYINLGEMSLASESARRAYELRERVSEPEKFLIEANYYEYFTGNLEKARQTCELWAQTYPRDDNPRGDGIGIYFALGQYDRALDEARANLRLAPAIGIGYGGLVMSYLALNRLAEARATAEEAQAKNLDSPFLRDDLYELSFLQNDGAGMAQQLAWATGKPGSEDLLLALEADTAAYSGRLGKARDLSRRAVASAERAEEKETAALYEADAALREALFGNAAEARERAGAALALSTGRDVEYGAALALAFGGDAAREQAQIETLAEDLARRFPEDTVVKFNYLPTIRAQVALNRSDLSKAMKALQSAAPYELGTPGGFGFPPALFPVYVRGDAYLAAHQGSEAAGEFQKIRDHRGVVLNEPIGALAHLGIGRAYAIEAAAAQGDQAASFRAKARTAYQDFLTLWKEAVPDIPILRKARTEYAKLQ
jgi:DNA-binding winged helix-turn-helix (wHTH) protein